MSEDVNIREVVEARVRAEHETEIQAEIERRLAAVEAAMSGGVEPPPAPRKPRADKGTRRGPRRAKAAPATPDLPDLSDHLPGNHGGEEE